MSSAAVSVLDILALETLEDNIFRGYSPQVGWRRVFGGQVIGQALAAATRTVPKARNAHSLHCYFIHPGDPEVPIIYAVKHLRDGRSFTTRYVEAIQHGQAIFTLTASFHVEETGPHHQPSMPCVPPPEALDTKELKEAFIARLPSYVRAYFEMERPIELRPVDYNRFLPSTERSLKPSFDVWMKATATLPNEQSVHTCVLAYASDMTLLDTSLATHGRSIFDGDIQGASLDHAMWLHQPFRADEWLLYSQESPFSGGARGLSRGFFFTREGKHVATVAQEGLIRPIQRNAWIE